MYKMTKRDVLDHIFFQPFREAIFVLPMGFFAFLAFGALLEKQPDLLVLGLSGVSIIYLVGMILASIQSVNLLKKQAHEEQVRLQAIADNERMLVESFGRFAHLRIVFEEAFGFYELQYSRKRSAAMNKLQQSIDAMLVDYAAWRAGRTPEVTDVAMIERLQALNAELEPACLKLNAVLA